MEVFGEVDFFGSPEGCFRFLVHLPNLIENAYKPRNSESTLRVTRMVNTNLMILNGEKHEAVGILL